MGWNGIWDEQRMHVCPLQNHTVHVYCYTFDDDDDDGDCGSSAFIARPDSMETILDQFKSVPLTQPNTTNTTLD